jgi:probable HAF family extracellular repeat protein
MARLLAFTFGLPYNAVTLRSSVSGSQDYCNGVSPNGILAHGQASGRRRGRTSPQRIVSPCLQEPASADNKGSAMRKYRLVIVAWLMTIGWSLALAQPALADFQVTDLGTLGGTPSAAYAINADGQIAGISYTSDGVRHAFLWQNGVMSDLGTFNGGAESQGLAINNSGQVVGVSDINGATLWRGGQIIDLNSLVSPGSGLQLRVAQGINAAGNIVGQGYHVADGSHFAFLLDSRGVTDLGTLSSRNALN